MSIFGRRMTPELLAAELLRGLESGEIVFDEPDEPTKDPVADRVATLVEAALAPVRTQLQTTVDQATALLKQAESDRREAAEVLAQARAVLAEAAQTAARLQESGSQREGAKDSLILRESKETAFKLRD